MKNSDTLSIQLNIGTKSYPLEVTWEQEKTYRTAEKLINSKLNSYISTFPNLERVDYMAMTLIDLAVSLIQEGEMDSKVEKLIASIDQTLKLQEK